MLLVFSVSQASFHCIFMMSIELGFYFYFFHVGYLEILGITISCRDFGKIDRGKMQMEFVYRKFWYSLRTYCICSHRAMNLDNCCSWIVMLAGCIIIILYSKFYFVLDL